jgi:hypothetical protein
MVYEECLSTSCTIFICTPRATRALPALCLRVCRVVGQLSALGNLDQRSQRVPGVCRRPELGGEHQVLVILPGQPGRRSESLSSQIGFVPAQYLDNRRRQRDDPFDLGVFSSSSEISCRSTRTSCHLT